MTYGPIHLYVIDKLHSSQMALEISIWEGVHHKKLKLHLVKKQHKLISDFGKLQYTRNNIASPESIAGVQNAVGVLNINTDLALDMLMRVFFQCKLHVPNSL